MIVYQLIRRGVHLAPGGEPQTSWHGTLEEARNEGRRIAALMMSSEIRQYDIATDKNGILGLLNGRPEFKVEVGEKIRTWAFTKRGGLTETTDTGGPVSTQPEPENRVRTVASNFPTYFDDRTPQEMSDDELISHLKPASPPTAAEEQAHEDWKRRHPSPAEQRARATPTTKEQK